MLIHWLRIGHNREWYQYSTFNPRQISKSPNEMLRTNGYFYLPRMHCRNLVSSNQKNSWLQPTNLMDDGNWKPLKNLKVLSPAELIEFNAFHSIWEPYLSEITSSPPSIVVASDFFDGRKIWILPIHYPVSLLSVKHKGKCDIVIKQLLGFVSCFINISW